MKYNVHAVCRKPSGQTVIGNLCWFVLGSIVMTTKEKAISVINSLDDNATLDDMIDRLYLLRKIELGIAQADAGDVVDHEQFMAELEREDVD